MIAPRILMNKNNRRDVDRISPAFSILQRMPHGVACLWVDLLKLLEDGLHGRTIGGLLVRASHFLFVETCDDGKVGNHALTDKAERTNDGERIVLQWQNWGHGSEGALEGHVHEEGDEDVVLMVTECHLVEMVCYSKLEDCLAAMPGTEEAACLARIGALVEGGVEQVKLDAELQAEVAEVGAVGVVGDVVHDHMYGFHLDVGTEDASTLGKETSEHERVLATAKCYEYAVAIMQQGVLDARLVE